MKHKAIIDKLTPRQKADLLTGRDFWSTLPIDEVELPTAYLSDGPHGLRKQAAASDHLGLNASIPATCFPTAASMANTWNPALGEEMGKYLGEEAAAQGVNVLLGPGMNIKRNPLCGRNFEYFSEDPLLAGKMAGAYVRGIQSQGVSACLKHFAANNQEERRMVVDSVIDERTLREIYLTGFEIAVEEGNPGAIMSSYNRLNGNFTNENMHLMQEILRNEWNYKGVVVTDWAGCNDRVQGVIAGNELEMPACRYGADDVYKAMTEGYTIPFNREEDPLQYDAIAAGLKDGKLDMQKVDEALDRLIDLILTTDKALQSANKEFDVEAHHDFARRCAEESTVLLKNDGVLPIGKEKVCFIGDFADQPRYQGAGSSIVNPTKMEKFIDAEKDHDFNFIGYEQGFKRFGGKSDSLAKKAIELAKKADTVLFFAGLDEIREAEGLDRQNMKLPENQLSLLKELYTLGKKVVVILFCGSAVELDVIEDADAIVHAYLGGQAGVLALLNILTGKVNPSGKLSESYPYRYEHCSSAAHFPGHQMTVEYREGLFVGYRHYTSAGEKVRYPFGYGLSYTTFAYSDLTVDENGAKFTVKNTGDRDGAEVAQLYVGKEDTAIIRPVRELKGFEKVFLKAGESKEVFIPFGKRTFRVYNPKAKEWQVEGGDYEIMVGSSSETILLTGKISVKGNMTDFGYEKDALPDYFSGKAANVDEKQFETLLGRPVPDSGYHFYKKNRMVIHENCTVADLKYARGWVGRAFSGAISLYNGILNLIGNKTMSNTIIMGVWHQPVRGLAKFGSMTRGQMEGLLLLFNGSFFKGLKKLLFKEKKENQ